MAGCDMANGAADEAIRTLTSLSRGIYPRTLAEHGLPAGHWLEDPAEGDCFLDWGAHCCDAFRWLTANAARYGFTMTYRQGNAEGYLYEPWHWCYAGRA